MWLDYKQYKHHTLVDELLLTAQEELKKYLKTRSQYEMAPLDWFEKQYGHELPLKEILKLWWTVPSIRAGKFTEWSSLLPNVSKAALNLPGIINFSLNCISPGGSIPIHSDYSYDMRVDLSNSKKAFVILIAVDIPSTDIQECGFELGGEKVCLRTGDIVAFDGAIPHGSWNYSKSWRYTINMDIEKDQWNV